MRTLTLISIAIGILSTLIYTLTPHIPKFSIFDPAQLHEVAKSAIAAHGNDTAAVVSHIVDQLSQTHGRYLSADEEWLFNNAGGAMGAMYILHASITEYLIIFGTPLGTEGHSGRHTADDYFFVLYGEELAYKPGPGVYAPERYPAGSVNLMKWGEVKQYKMQEGCFALEYARGWIPGMLAFGFADTFTSTLDFPTLWRTIWVTGREMVGNLLIGKL